MKRQYIAIVVGKDGRRLYQSTPHETREAAKVEAFAARPKARRCSTGCGFGGSFNIRWHDRQWIKNDDNSTKTGHAGDRAMQRQEMKNIAEEQKGRLLISFSGGESSAFMTWWALQNWRRRYAEIIVLFANTGEENEKTLNFVNACDAHFGFETIWVEADIRHGTRRSVEAKIVTFESASRNGEPFEDMIIKYGIPNQSFKHRTRVLKLEPIHAYVKSIGWGKGTYDTAIGIRVDEIDRIAYNADKNRIIYPLIQAVPVTKSQINSWWADQPFRLGLRGNRR
jgi:3'-phosphoadenosine 5'-phosphosulfate sulfotransferase (PAPS reductase)/FAD synthetase